MRLQLIALLALAGGCAGDPIVAEPPPVDRTRFEAEVYPVLLRDCGFPACHGEPARFFRVFGPGRTRLEPSTDLYEPPTSAEIDASFDRARSMLAAASDPAQSWLVRKPLEPEAGGSAHEGLDALGRNVYRDRTEPGWRAIASWAGVRLEEGLDAGLRDAGGIDAASSDADLADGAAEDAP